MNLQMVILLIDRGGAAFGAPFLLAVLHTALINVSYLLLRIHKTGIDEMPIWRTFSYLILCAVDILSAEQVTQLINQSIYRDKGDTMPESVKDVLLMPIAYQLLAEMQDVCSSDCRRISFIRNTLTKDQDEVDHYWLRLEPDGVEERS
jgi:hypothetical protein